MTDCSGQKCEPKWQNITAWPYKDLLLADALTLNFIYKGDTANGPVKFLGMQIHILHDTVNAKEGLINHLKQMLTCTELMHAH